MSQTGVMRADARHPWAAFHARQTIAINESGFVWRARTGPFGCVTVTDALKEVGAGLTVKALGLVPLARVPVDDMLTKGELMRYLAELPFSPDAILHNASLQWEVLDSNTLRVAGVHGKVRAEVDLTIGADGLLSSAFSPARPRLEGTLSVERPWRCVVSDYRLHEGRQVPFAAQAAWVIDGAETPVWRGKIEHWTVRPRA